MAMSFRSASYAARARAGSAVSTLTINLPAGVSNGDLLILSFVAREAGTPTPADAAILRSNTGGGTSFTDVFPRNTPGLWSGTNEFNTIWMPNVNDASLGQRTFYSTAYRVASSEPASYTFTTASAEGFDYASAELLCYQGYDGFAWNADFAWCDPSAPTAGTSRASGSGWDAPSIGLEGAEPLLCYGFAQVGSSATMTPPSGMTERSDNWQTGSGFLMTSADLASPSSPSGVKSFTSSANGDRGFFVSLGKRASVPQIYRRR